MTDNMRPIFVYALVSTRDGGLPWYIGQSVDVFGRLKKHVLSGHVSKVEWMRAERAAGFEIQARILEECGSQAQANDREAYWIDYFLTINPELLNGTRGGNPARPAYLQSILDQQRTAMAADAAWLAVFDRSAQ
jgi:hypothetical protein